MVLTAIHRDVVSSCEVRAQLSARLAKRERFFYEQLSWGVFTGNNSGSFSPRVKNAFVKCLIHEEFQRRHGPTFSARTYAGTGDGANSFLTPIKVHRSDRRHISS